MVRPTTYKIDLRLSLPGTGSLPPPPPPTTAPAAEGRPDGVFHVKAEFHHALWPLRIARLLPNFRRFYLRATLTVPRGGESFPDAVATVRRLLTAMDLVLPEQVVFGAAQKLHLLSCAVARSPSVDAAPVLALDARLTALLGRRDSAAAVAAAEAAIETVPAARSAIEALECVKIGSVVDQGQCSICCEEFADDHDGDDQRFVRMPCSHVYHKDCIVQWLEKNHKCPLCGHAMPTDECN